MTSNPSTGPYADAFAETDLRFAFSRIGSLIREGVYKQFPEACPECGGGVLVSHGGDRVRCWASRGVDDCGWNETRCHDCGVTPSGWFTYVQDGDLLNPPCVQHRGYPL